VGATGGHARSENQDLAQEARTAAESSERWDVTKARGTTRDIDFSTSEGTWMSADISPDGRWIVFDLLAHIYRVPIEGGEAECLTQSSGVALNFHPRISPDGTTIAFVSDRQGQNNLWLMNADGAQPRAVFTDKDVRVFEPAWSPDGRYIYVRRQDMHRNGGSGIWMYSREGGEGIEIVGRDIRGRNGRVLLPTASSCTSRCRPRRKAYGRAAPT
jgi:Tol biopolymer transport system component